MRKSGIIWAWLFIVLIAMSGCATLPDSFESQADHSVSGLEETLKRLENERLLFLGEAHTSDSDHLFQLEVLRYLHLKGKRPVLAIEVFPRERQEVLNAWSGGYIDEYAFEKECEKIWDELYSYYGEIFRFCRASGIPIFGISTVKGFISSVARQGPVIISSEQLRAIHFSECASAPDYEKLMKKIEAMDIHADKIRMPFFCDSQRLLDTIMAKNISELLENRDVTVVVLAGAAHTSNIAVPGILSSYRAVRYKVLMPSSFREIFPAGEADGLADYFWY